MGRKKRKEREGCRRHRLSRLLRYPRTRIYCSFWFCCWFGIGSVWQRKAKQRIFGMEREREREREREHVVGGIERYCYVKSKLMFEFCS
jgi:hypothetical protein